MLVEGNGRQVLAAIFLRLTQGKGFESVERRGGGLFDGHAHFLNGSQRFAEFLPQTRRRFSQSPEHVLLVFGLHLLETQRIARRAVHRAQRDHVTAAKTGNGAAEHGFETFALADVTGNLAGHALIRLPADVAHRGVCARFRKNGQVGRLLQLHHQRLFERHVEHSVAGGVHEIGQHHGVLGAPRARMTRAPPKDTAGQYGYSCGSERGLSQMRGSPGRHRWNGGSGIVRITLPRQAFQVRAHIRSGLVAGLPVFLESFENDPLEIVGNGRTDLARRAGCTVEQCVKDHGFSWAIERQLASRHFVEHHAEREKVCASVRYLSPGLLRRHIGHGADGGAGIGQVLGFYGHGG